VLTFCDCARIVFLVTVSALLLTFKWMFCRISRFGLNKKWLLRWITRIKGRPRGIQRWVAFIRMYELCLTVFICRKFFSFEEFTCNGQEAFVLGTYVCAKTRYNFLHLLIVLCLNYGLSLREEHTVIIKRL